MSEGQPLYPGANDFKQEKQDFLDFINQEPVPSVDELLKYVRNMPIPLQAELVSLLDTDTDVSREHTGAHE